MYIVRDSCTYFITQKHNLSISQYSTESHLFIACARVLIIHVQILYVNMCIYHLFIMGIRAPDDIHLFIMCICVYITYVDMCLFIYLLRVYVHLSRVYVYLCIHLFVCVSVCIFFYYRVHVCVNYVHIHVYMCTRTYIYLNTCACIYHI